jgi:hypothetical protein
MISSTFSIVNSSPDDGRAPSNPQAPVATTGLKTIVYRGITYTCPLSTRFRRHTDDELEAIRSTAKQYGIRNAIRIYTDTTADPQGHPIDNCVLDGEGRLTIASELNLEFVEMVHEELMTTEEAYELAKVDNDARRQDDPEEIRKRRVERVVESRSKGESLRTIADKENVSVIQIQRDLKTGEKSGKTKEKETPKQVKGKDGREQKAKKTKKSNSDSNKTQVYPPGTPGLTSTQPAQTAKNTGDVSAEADQQPETVPENEQFVAVVTQLCRDMDQNSARIKALKESPFSYWIHVDSAVDQLKSARETLWAGRPAFPCPYCAAEQSQGCSACKQMMWVSKRVHDNGKKAVGDIYVDSSMTLSNVKPQSIELKSNALEYAHEAINALKKIPRNDPRRDRGYQMVLDFIHANSKKTVHKASCQEPNAKPPDPLFDALVHVTQSDPKGQGSFVGKTAAALRKFDPPITPDEVRDFARRWRTLLPWANVADNPRLTLGIISNHVYVIRQTENKPSIEVPKEIRRKQYSKLVSSGSMDRAEAEERYGGPLDDPQQSTA